MAKIFIKGTKEETEKTYNLLRESFSQAIKRAKLNDPDGTLLIVDVYQSPYDGDGFSDEQILKALECCAKNGGPKCKECPYVKEDDCKIKMQEDAAVMLSRWEAKRSALCSE